jgi:hypothetical protein
VQVVEINVNSVSDCHTHKSEAFRGKTVISRGIGTGVPFHTGENRPRKVSNGVEATSNPSTTSCSCPIWMCVGFIDVSMVIEIMSAFNFTEVQKNRIILDNRVSFFSWHTERAYLLHMNNIITILSKLGANCPCIHRLIARNIVAIEYSRQAGHIHSQDIERSRSSRFHGCTKKRGSRKAEKRRHYGNEQSVEECSWYVAVVGHSTSHEFVDMLQFIPRPDWQLDIWHIDRPCSSYPDEVPRSLRVAECRHARLAGMCIPSPSKLRGQATDR